MIDYSIADERLGEALREPWTGKSWKKNMTDDERLLYNKCRREEYQNSPSVRKRRRGYETARHKEKIEFLASLKASGCSVCGEKRQWCLDFHHVDSSEKEISIGWFRRYSFERIVSEAEKCIVLCANCHRDLHHSLRLSSLVGDDVK